MFTRNRQQIISEDYLRSLSDNQLRKLFLEFRAQINKTRRKKKRSKELEIDFCWIQLELQDRNEFKKTTKNKN